tara:strand:- start:58 stop:324 length:267 start_codon:yes stop_codon:yes gene_type:complete
MGIYVKESRFEEEIAQLRKEIKQTKFNLSEDISDIVEYGKLTEQKPKGIRAEIRSYIRIGILIFMLLALGYAIFRFLPIIKSTVATLG